MTDFKKVLETANRGYSNRKDYPAYSMTSWGERVEWSKYLEKINDELDVEKREFDWLTTTDLMCMAAAIQAAVIEGFRPSEIGVLWDGAVTVAREIREDFVHGTKPERDGD